MADELVYDVSVNVLKGAEGYGIYFNSGTGVIKVTKLDKGSEAERAGVVAGDQLVAVQDNDGKIPRESPGKRMDVNTENYQAVLQHVREMKNCKLYFMAGSAAF